MAGHPLDEPGAEHPHSGPFRNERAAAHALGLHVIRGLEEGLVPSNKAANEWR
jgi:hypothetical protein